MVFRELAVKKAEQLLEAHRKIVGAHGLARTAQGKRGDRVGARRAAEAQIDAARMQRLEDAERLGHVQRRMIGQHHAARSDANTAGGVRHGADHHLGRGAGNQGRVVVFGEPVARVAKILGESREIERIVQRFPAGRA